MSVLVALVAGPALAAPAVLRGEMCERRFCSAYSMTLNDDLSFSDTLGRRGTYTMTELRGRQALNWQMGTLRGSILSNGGGDPCWTEAVSPLNPALGSVAICLTAALQSLKPYTPSCEDNPLWTTGPAADEDGHWLAGRLTPTTAAGMWIHRVRYYLNSDTQWCEPYDHQVQLFVTDAASDPPASPTVVYEFAVSAASLGSADTYVDLDLPAPLLIEGDESLFVSIEQHYTSPDARSCTALCIQDAAEPERVYWSYADAAPFAWEDLESWGFNPMMISAEGIVAGP